MSITDTVEQQGFALARQVVDADTLHALTEALEASTESGRRRRGSVYAVRNLIEAVPEVARLAESSAIRTHIEPHLGAAAFAVRGLLFDKNEAANWNVPWHQDVSIAVRSRIETPGFQSWTSKEGVAHVQPPVSLLSRMLTVRLHLDPCGKDNGPLRIVPRTHQLGRLTPAQIEDIRRHQEAIDILADPGDLLIMRPLLLHASSSAAAPAHRRIVHIEYAAEPLPGGLEWHAARAADGSGWTASATSCNDCPPPADS